MEQQKQYYKQGNGFVIEASTNTSASLDFNAKSVRLPLSVSVSLSAAFFKGQRSQAHSTQDKAPARFEKAIIEDLTELISELNELNELLGHINHEIQMANGDERSIDLEAELQSALDYLRRDLAVKVRSASQLDLSTMQSKSPNLKDFSGAQGGLGLNFASQESSESSANKFFERSNEQLVIGWQQTWKPPWLHVSPSGPQSEAKLFARFALPSISGKRFNGSRCCLAPDHSARQVFRPIHDGALETQKGTAERLGFLKKRIEASRQSLNQGCGGEHSCRLDSLERLLFLLLDYHSTKRSALASGSAVLQ